MMKTQYIWTALSGSLAGKCNLPTCKWEVLLGSLYLAMAVPTASAAWLSDGSDGVFSPTGSVTLDLPDDGIFNFTTINIPSNVTVKFNKNSLDTPVYLLATGSVNISGVIDISAGGVSLADLSSALGYIRPATTSVSGPGGGIGGLAGLNSSAYATAGTGLSPGQPGPNTSNPTKGLGIAGGAGGMATAGLTAILYGPGVSGSPAIPYPIPLTGGSGGGGGGGGTYAGVPLSGGAGGGGAGALLVATPDNIAVSGSLLALGGNGGWAMANVFSHGGPGGGGSGGNIALIGDSVTLLASTLVEATGGFGGGLSTQTYTNNPLAFESGARGGTGYLYVEANQISLQGTLNAQVVAVPEPETWAMLLTGLGLVSWMMVRQRR